MVSQLIDNSKSNIWDISTRSRTSAFSWRGQFTPDLVKLLFDNFDTGFGLVIDPFMGSGTVINEAIARGRDTVGIEINPAAFILAEVFRLANVSKVIRANSLELLTKQINELADGAGTGNATQDLISLINETKNKNLLILAKALLLISMGDGSTTSYLRVKKAISQLEEVLSGIPEYDGICKLEIGDSRNMNLEDASVGFLVTSPPYINVFNYHQNYRPAVELLEYEVLEYAKSEIGSNRKFRSNRLFTVVQYGLDMSQFLSELARVMMPNAVAVLVIGRESNVRGMSFRNAVIVEDILLTFKTFTLIDKQYRKFTSRFGIIVYEEILVIKRNKVPKIPSPDLVLKNARVVTRKHLESWVKSQSGQALQDLNQTIEKIETILPSKLH